MAFIYVADGIDDVLAAHLNQYADAWTGVAGKGQPFNAVAVNDPINFAVSARNLDPTNSRAAQFLKADGTVLFQCDASGVKISPDGTVASVPVTAAATQTLTNKTLTAPTLTGTVVVSAATLGALINGALSSSSAVLGADVTMVTPSTTWYSGPSLSLVAGTWLVTATLTIATPAGGAATFDARLFDGVATSYAVASTTVGGASQWGDIAVTAIISLAATTTITAQAISNLANTLIRSGAANSALAASRISAVRIA